MATVTQLKDRIKRRLSRVALTNLDTIVVDELTHAQTEILEQQAWLPHFLRSFADITITGSHYSIALTTAGKPAEQNIAPAGFLRMLEPNSEVTGLAYLDVNTKPIPIPRFDSFVQLKQLYGDGGDLGTYPQGYYWDGNPEGALQLRPRTIGTVRYFVNFYGQAAQTPTSPDGSNTTVWTRRLGDLLMHTAGVEIATYLRDQTALEYFVSKRQEADKRAKDQKVAQDQGDTEMVMGD